MSFQAFMHFFHPAEMNAPWLGFGFSAVGSAINFVGAAWIRIAPCAENCVTHQAYQK